MAIIPALDEEETLPGVLRGIGPHVDRVVVVDNGSRDRTAQVAREAGAEVVWEPHRGYGNACLAGVAGARAFGADVLVFLDADGSDDPDDASRLVSPVLSGAADLALGTRARRTVEPGAMTLVQAVGNWLVPACMRILLGAPYHDLPPFKAISAPVFDSLGVTDRGGGFTIDLLLRAHRRGLRVVEVPVRCRARRGGVSKVSGDPRAAARAALRIVEVLGRHVLERGRAPASGTGLAGGSKRFRPGDPAR